MALTGCDLEAPGAPRATPGVTVHLLTPPGQPLVARGSAAQIETTRVWLYTLGESETQAITVRPAAGDGAGLLAQAEATDSEALLLEAPRPWRATYWRLFAERGSAAGTTTLRISPETTEHTALVVLAPPLARMHRLIAYSGFAVQAETSPPAGALGGPDAVATRSLFPIVVANPEAIDGLAVEFAIAGADSATLYADPGSRLFDSGAENAFHRILQRLPASPPEEGRFQALVYPRISQGAGEMIGPGSSVLFYVVAYGATLPTGLCIDPETARFSLSQGDSSLAPEVINPAPCP